MLVVPIVPTAGFCLSVLFRSSVLPVYKSVTSKCLFNLGFNFSKESYYSPTMSGMERLQKNSKIAEGLIAEISSKIKSLTPDVNVDKIQDSNEELRKEVEKWTEILTMIEIRKGLEPSFYLHYITEGEAQPAGSATNNASQAEEPKAPAPAKDQPKKESKPNKKGGDGAKKPEVDENLNAAEKPAKQAKKSASKPVAAAASATVTAAEVIDISRLDLRIGKIVEVDRHPEADSLYLEKIDVGEANPRTIISGLVKHVPLEEMRNRMVVVLCNLKPAKMRGILSEGMVMCASSPDKVEVLNPPSGVVPGDVIEFEGYVRNPDPVMNPKKKIFETVAPDLKTNDNKVATYKGVPFSVQGKGVVVADTLTNVQVK